jgi:hypothetical protein
MPENYSTGVTGRALFELEKYNTRVEQVWVIAVIELTGSFKSIGTVRLKGIDQ